jgi:hypothetical protein
MFKSSWKVEGNIDLSLVISIISLIVTFLV